MQQQVYNVIFTTNDAYVNYLIVLLESIFETNTEKKFCFFVLYNSLSESKKERLTEYVSEHNAQINFLYIAGEKYKVFQLEERFTVETYFRLEIQDLLPKDVERVLFLDTDMIVCNDLSELYHMDFENKYLIACGFSPRCEKGDEFNAGMILYNIKKMRENNITFETYVELAEKLNGNFYLDQGLLNEMFGTTGTKYVWKQKYNFTCPFYRKYREEVQKETPGFSLDDIVVLHYPGPGIRPWQACLAKEEFERLKKNGLLDIFAMKGYIIDDLYIEVLEKWWAFAKNTPVYEELLTDMFRMKSSIYEQVLLATVNTKAYRLGNSILRIPKKVKTLLKKG